MLQITPQMKILVAVEPADFRRGIDGLARLCQETLQHDPFAGAVFVFRNRKATAQKLLIAWCSAMLEKDRLGFIAREPLESLRKRFQKTAAR